MTSEHHTSSAKDRPSSYGILAGITKNLSKKIKQDLDIHKIKTNDKKFTPEKTTTPTKTIERSSLIKTVKVANQKKKIFKKVYYEL